MDKFIVTLGISAKCLVGLGALCAPLLLLIVGIALPAIVFWLVASLLLCLPNGVFVSLLFLPFTFPACWEWASNYVKSELELAKVVGKDAALWSQWKEDSFGHTVNRSVLKRPVQLMLASGFDYAVGSLPVWLLDWAEVEDHAEAGMRTVGSHLWVKALVFADSTIFPAVPPYFLAWAGFVFAARTYKASFSAGCRIFWWWCVAMTVVVCLPNAVVGRALWMTLVFAWRVSTSSWSDASTFRQWFLWRCTAIIVSFTAWAEALNTEVERHHSSKIAGGSARFVAHFRVFTIQFVQVVNDIQLPNFIRNRFTRGPSLEILEESNKLMEAIGWPINTNLTTDITDVNGIGSFKEWILCGSDFATGLQNLKVQVDTDLDSLRVAALCYKRTEQYMTEENELESLSRYFSSRKYDMPEINIDDVWLLVGDIFRHSRLTPFKYIIAMWDKKNALGSFMRNPFGRRKYKRQAFISHIGGIGPFKRLWARTFHYASLIWPVAHVSVKAEALPERKWANNMVRTVVGSPISQYILSTIFNYGPNHRFAWETTPIKIGMPLNGYWMSRVWERHSRCQIHVEGDFTAFDSTVSGPVVEVIKAVRKKGFEGHKDKVAIADLIDVNYDQVVHQLLNTTSTGNIYKKGTGLTTGHSSTSMDNSVALVTLYLMAWKELTGLSAREFLHFNELSCFGDDHILSMCQVRPLSWSPSNIRKVMSKWGVSNNVEVSRLDKIGFLAKFWRQATPGDMEHLKHAGVTGFRSIVWHDRVKLLGKLTAPVKSLVPNYRVRRLLSYLSLTAHHPDIYAGIVKVLMSSKAMVNVIKAEAIQIPSYAAVVKNWYSSGHTSQPATHFDEEEDEMFKTGKFVEYGSVTLADHLLNSLSMVPDLLNPVMFNFGYGTALQLKLRPLLSWAIDFVAIQNNCGSSGVLAAMLRRTPYRPLDPSLFPVGASGANMTEMLLRHWLFVAYCSVRPTVTGFALANFFLSKVASTQFIMNGRMLSEQRQADFQIDYIIVIALLGLVSGIPDVLSPFASISLPDFNMFLELLFHFALVTIWSSVPANYKEVAAVVNNMGSRTGPILVEAATGTGKSTSMIAFLYQAFGHKYDKFVVLEPRSILVHGLVPYMRLNFALPVSGGTTGMDIDKSQRIFYLTPQSFFGNLDLLGPKTMVILDECHLNEVFPSFIRQLFKKHSVPYLMTTATPSAQNLDDAGVHVKLDSAALFSRKEDLVDCSKEACAAVDQSPYACLRHFKQSVLGEVASMPPSSKVLICVPTIMMVDDFVRSSKQTAVGLSAKHPIPVNWDARVYVSTPVSDVGLTIPGLTHVYTTDIASGDGEERFSKLSSSSLGQRFGRVGRTTNGRAVLYRYNLPLPDERSLASLTQRDMASMVFSGLPVEIGLSFDRNSTAAAIGLNPDSIPEDRWDDVARAAHVYYANLRPVLASHVAAASAQQQVYGTPAVLMSTDGNISSSWVTDPSQLAESATSLFGSIVKANLEGVPLQLGEVDNTLFSRAGPILAVKNLAVNLAADLAEGITDMVNPKNFEVATELSELVKIGQLLKSLSNA